MNGAEAGKQGLDRYLLPIDGWAMGFGCMVGWGAFVMPGTTFLPVAGPAGTVIALLIGVGVMLVLAGCFSYLMGHSPRTGGVYSYTKLAFGRDHAFLCSWFLCLSYLTIVFLNGTALFLVIRTVLGDSLRLGSYYVVAGNSIYFGEVAVSVFALATVGLMFMLAKPMLQHLYTTLSVALITGAIITAACCFPHVLSQDAVLSFGITGINPAYASFSLVILAPWAFVGFEVVSFETAHFRFPLEKAKRITVISILAAGFVYVSMSLVSVASIPDGFASWAEYINSLGSQSGVASVPTFYAARSIMGPVGLVVIAISAFAAILTGIIGGYRAIMRVLSTMAEEHILSEKFSKTSYSILFVMLLSILISLLGRNTLIWFVDLTSFGAIVAYGYTSAAAWKLARAEGNRRVMTLGAIGAVVSLIFALVQLIPRLSALEAMGSEAFLLLSLWCLLGFVFYWRTIERSPLAQYSGMSTSGTVLFVLLMYCAIMWIAKLIFSRTSIAEVHATLLVGGIVLLLIIFVGLVVMLYIQNLVREKHEAAEREKIRAMEGSLAKSQFLFNMSHDIRTPMNAIIGYTNLAMKEESLPVVRSYLTKIGASSDHLLALINDVLEMSRIESGKLELEYAPTNLRQVFEDIRDLFSEQMQEKGLDYSVHINQMHDQHAWCDKNNLNRVLLNLIGNSYKFTPAGGTVSVSAWENAAGEDEYGTYEIRVKDSGIGMSKEFVDKMFTAFERERTSTDSGTQGTGLGLAITKGIVDMMGGTIEVLTTPGSGTEIIIRLKLKIAHEDDMEICPSQEKSRADDQRDFSGKRLLLVEDNAINMEIARMILTQQGFEVEAVENGKEAVDAVLSRDPGYYDAVLMDIQMPIMDGYTATREIRSLKDEKRARIPILAMTANAFKEDETAAKEAGMQAHIAKPIDVNMLMKTLSGVLEEAASKPDSAGERIDG